MNNDIMLQELIKERLNFMYGDMNSKVPARLPDSSVYGENERFYVKYQNVFTPA